MKYNKNTDFFKTFEILNTQDEKFQKRSNFVLTGRGGESSVLVFDVIEAAFKKINEVISKQDSIKGALEQPLHTGEQKILDAVNGVSAILPGIPDMLAKANLDGVISFVPLVFSFLASTISDNQTIMNFPQKVGLNIIADTVTSLAESGAFNGGLNSMIDDLVKVTDVNTYENWTYRQVTTGL